MKTLSNFVNESRKNKKLGTKLYVVKNSMGDEKFTFYAHDDKDAQYKLKDYEMYHSMFGEFSVEPTDNEWNLQQDYVGESLVNESAISKEHEVQLIRYIKDVLDSAQGTNWENDTLIELKSKLESSLNLRAKLVDKLIKKARVVNEGKLDKYSDEQIIQWYTAVLYPEYDTIDKARKELEDLMKREKLTTSDFNEAV